MKLLNFYEKIKNCFKHSLVKRYLSNSLWMILSRMGWIFTALTIGVIVARKLGPKDYGVVSFVVAYVGMFSVFVNLGVASLISRNLIVNSEELPRIMGNYTAFKVITTIIMYLCFFASVQYIEDPTLRNYCIIVSLGYICFPLTSVSEYFSSFVKNQYKAFAELLTCFIYNAIRLTAVLCSASLVYYIYAESVQAFSISLLLFLFYVFKCGNPLKWSFSLREALALFKPAFPLSMVVMLSMVYARVDTLMLKHFQSFEEIGYYSIATRFTENLSLIISSVCTSVFASAVISGYRAGGEEYKKQLHRYYFLLISIAITLVVPSLLLGYPVINFLYNKPFLPAVNVFYIYVFTLIFTAVNCAFTCHAINENRLKTILFVSLSGVLINILINLYTIPHYAALGAAISSLVSMPLGFILVLLSTKEGRADLWFIGYSVTHLPSFKFSDEVVKND